MADQAKAILRHARISPRKVCIVLDLIRGKDADVAEAIMKNTRKSAAEYIVKLVHSAIHNAVENEHLNEDSLYISECFVTPGPTLKRMMPRARGSADRILKRTSHITVIVKERSDEALDIRDRAEAAHEKSKAARADKQHAKKQQA
jgi:large subunit ribosomal protein L22